MKRNSKMLTKRSVFSAVVAVVLALGLMVPFASAQADPASDAQSEADQALAKLNDLGDQLDAAQNDYQSAVEEQKAAEEKVSQAQAQIDETTEKVAVLQKQLGDRAKEMYRSGGTSFIDVLLGSSSFEEFATNLSLFNKLNENDAELVQETKDARTELENAKKEAETQAQVASDKAAEAQQVMESAQSAQNEAQSVYDNLSAEAQQLMEEREEAESAANAQAAQEAISNGTVSAGNSNNDSSNSSGGNFNNDKGQSVSGNIVVQRAYAQLGKPYVWGAAGPNSFDCSGLVGYCLTGVYGNHWCSTGTIEGWTPVSNPQPGDICIRPGHTGIYIGGGQMIHASTTGYQVRIGGVQSGMWYVRY